MTDDEREILEQITSQVYGYREVCDVNDPSDVKDCLDRAQSMAVAIEALCDGNIDKAQRLVERYSLHFG